MYMGVETAREELKVKLVEILGPEKTEQAQELALAIDNLIEKYIWRLEDEIKYKD